MDIRCVCSRKPLLAIGGRDSETGEPFVHLRAVKGDRIVAEMIATSGTVRLHCRECLRWATIEIQNVRVDQEAARNLAALMDGP
jgi:hypothetical protein